MTWQDLTNDQQLETIKEDSHKAPVLIFKHSTRCSTSAMVLDRLERKWKDSDMAPVTAYFLDLLQYRPVSDKIQSTFYVQHESPQVLLIKDGRCIYHASHIDISYDEIKQQAATV
jgi:bacillithiol system protein YtxJ